MVWKRRAARLGVAFALVAGLLMGSTATAQEPAAVGRPTVQPKPGDTSPAPNPPRTATASLAAPSLALTGCDGSTMHRNDDEFSDLVSLPFAVDFYGTTYSSLYVNNNGNVTFDEPLSTYVPFDLSSTERVIIAPFFADVDTRPDGSGTVSWGTTTYDGRTAFCVLWNDVGYFPNQTDLRNTFQLLLVDRGLGNFDIVYRYAQVQWELGSASDGVAARVGFSNGDPARSVQLLGSAQSGAFLDGGPRSLVTGSVNSSQPGTWVFSIRSGNHGNDPRNVPAGFAPDSDWWTWPDADGDGLPDHWESNGVYVNDRLVDLPAYGVSPTQRDALVYVDVAQGERWNTRIESMITSSFASSPLGVRLHFIRGARTLARSELPSAIDPSDHFFSQLVRLGFSSTGLGGSPGSVPALAKYACVCPNHADGPTVGGQANGIRADHLVVTMDEPVWLEDIAHESGLSFATADDLVSDRLNAITMMHELGHLYGLRHHGHENEPVHDPAYKSIMSYAYNAWGVPSSSGASLRYLVDFSRQSTVNLDWRLGATPGALSFVYGQHGERGDFYRSVAEVAPPESPTPHELGIDEMLADPAIREHVLDGAEGVVDGACNEAAFPDVNHNNQFCFDITWMADTGLTTGYDDGTFRPVAPVTRQAMAAFIWRHLGSVAPQSTTPHFADVAPSHPFFTAIQWMFEAGISTGTAQASGKPLFKPSDAISRQAMAAFLWRLQDEPDASSTAHFADVTASTSPFYSAIQWMYEAEVSTGTPQSGARPLYKPVDPVSRQAMAAFIFRFAGLR